MTPVFQLPSLKRLHLGQTRCFISGIRPSEKLIKKLEDLDFSANDLTRLPDTLLALKNLKVLNLANNKVTFYCFLWRFSIWE